MHKHLFALVFLLLCAPATFAQRADPRDPKNEQQGIDLIKAAIAARGGEAYLKFKTIFANGTYTPYDKGVSTVPKSFQNWIAYPDRDRTEFGKGKRKNRIIQVSAGNGGWIYDGDAETLKDQSPKQIADFQEGLEFDIDHLLRGGWQKEGVKVRFFGREETRPGERADVVEIKLTEEKTVLLMLDRYTKLPMSLSYEKMEGRNLSRREVRFFQYVAYGGVKFPNIVDYFRDGLQDTRLNYLNVETDAPVPEDLFTKPASVKLIK